MWWYSGNPLTTRIDWKPTTIGKSIVVVPPPVNHWWYSGNPLTTRLDWRPTFNGSTLVAAQYLLLRPHWINNTYYDAGTVLTEGSLYTAGVLPTNWVPTLAVDPLNTRAVNAFYAVGPRRGGYYEDINWWAYIITPLNPMIQAVTYWKNTSGNTWVLTGLGANLPPVTTPPLIGGVNA